MWVCVAEYRGYKIEVLKEAESGDPMDYRVCDRMFRTVGEAMVWIDEQID